MDISRILQNIKSKLYAIVGRAVVTALDNSGGMLLAQVQFYGSETYDGMHVLQNYGFESMVDTVDEGNETLVCSQGGSRTMSTIVAIHNPEHRPRTLNSGEVMIYSKFGQSILLKSDGSVRVTGNLLVSTGATGTFTSQDGKMVVVNSGIVTSIT